MEAIALTATDAFAVIIGIENYQYSDGPHAVPRVDYARKDAEEFKKLLLDDFGLREDQVVIWLDQQATRTALENELPYLLRNLSDRSRFFFYYAGHGYRSGSENLLTAWDTHPSNLEGTSVLLKDVLLEPLGKSSCKQSLVFVDACAKNLPGSSRDIISSLDPKEFQKFIRSTSYHAQFMACSMGERSYSSPILKQGIWTWHLLQALKGKVQSAIARDRTITDTSLRDYLKRSVPDFITKKTQIKGTQTPWANVSAGNTFEIRTLPIPDNETAQQLASIQIEYKDAFLRRIEILRVRSFSGFQQGHQEPKWINTAGQRFIERVAEPDINEEVTTIYDNLKKELGMRRRDIEKNVDRGGGNVDTTLFRFVLEVRQSEDDSAEAVLTRTLTLRCKPQELPEKFDDVFPSPMQDVIIPFSGKADFDRLVEAFEDLEAAHGGSLDENDDDQTISYSMPKGAKITIFCDQKEVVVRPSRSSTIIALIEGTERAIKELQTEQKKLLKG